MHSSVNILKAIELYSLNGRIVWYMNYTSIRLFLKSQVSQLIAFQEYFQVNKPLPCAQNFQSAQLSTGRRNQGSRDIWGMPSSWKMDTENGQKGGNKPQRKQEVRVNARTIGKINKL